MPTSEVICTYCTLLNTTTWYTEAIHNGLGQSRHPVLFEVNAEPEDLGRAIVLHWGILYWWQHLLECLVLEPIACTLALENIAEEVQKDLLLALVMLGFEDEEGGYGEIEDKK
ncbi:hypothetical protein C0995_014382 [Termitomyces sp. Mi166|nr:hypothetical protein C0995_014382 [Termitomyces sp. Mi166\